MKFDKQVVAWFVAIAAISASAQTTIQDSVITVQELLKIDNAQALDKATAEAIKAGLLQPKKSATSTVKEEPPLPKWTVLSVYGQQGDLVADLQVDNVLANASRTGAVVGMCKVVAIEDKCVTLMPEGKNVRKGSCVKVCWTGDELAEQLRPSQQVATNGSSTGAAGAQIAPKAGAPLPSPLPPVAMPLPTTAKKP